MTPVSHGCKFYILPIISKFSVITTCLDNYNHNNVKEKKTNWSSRFFSFSETDEKLWFSYVDTLRVTCLVDRRSLRNRGGSSWGASRARAPRAAASPRAAAAAPAPRCAAPDAAPPTATAAPAAPAAGTGYTRSRSGSWHTHTITPHSTPTGPLDIYLHISPISFYLSLSFLLSSPLSPPSLHPEVLSPQSLKSFCLNSFSHELHLLPQWNVSCIVFVILIVNVQPDLR